MRSNRPKVQIVEFCHDLIDPGILIAYTADGGRLRLTRVQDDILPSHRSCHCPLYANEHKQLFTINRGKLGQIFEAISLCSRTPGMHCHNGKRGCSYPQLRNFGHVAVHLVILTTFRGPRPVFPDGKAAEGDHKNGDVMDFSLENLEWVHPDENRWRSFHVLQVLRAKGINPALYTGTQMDKWFDMFRLLESYFTVLPHWQTFTAEDYLRWFDMPFDEFKTMWSKFPKPDPTFDKNEWDMTHHCEN